MNRLFLMYLLCAALSGCAGMAMQNANAEIKTCMVNVYNKPDYASITPHLPSPLNNFQPTMAQLSDDTKPTKQESRLLIEYHDDLMPCRQAYVEKIQNIAPTVVQVLSEEWVDSDRITIKLSKREITWGEAAQQRQEIVLAARKHLNEAAQTQMLLNAQQETANAATTQAQAAMFQAMKPPPIQIPAYQPTTTNCNAYGNTLNCRSY